MSRALAAFNVAPRPGWPAINFSFTTGITAHQQRTLYEPWSRPGDYVLMRALTDLVCVSSSCPDDIDPANGWNPTEASQIRVYPNKERFSIAMATRTTPDAEPVLTRESRFHVQQRRPRSPVISPTIAAGGCSTRLLRASAPPKNTSAAGSASR